MALAHLLAARAEEALGAEVGVVAADVDDRRAAADVGTSRAAPRDHGPDLDLVGVVQAARRRRRGCRRGSPAPTRGSGRVCRAGRATRHRARDRQLATGVAEPDLHPTILAQPAPTTDAGSNPGPPARRRRSCRAFGEARSVDVHGRPAAGDDYPLARLELLEQEDPRACRGRTAGGAGTPRRPRRCTATASSLPKNTLPRATPA